MLCAFLNFYQLCECLIKFRIVLVPGTETSSEKRHLECGFLMPFVSFA